MSLARFPLQRRHQLSQFVHVGLDHGRGESGASEVLSHWGSRHPPFQAGLQRDVHEGGRLHSSAERKQRLHLCGSRSIGVAAEPGLKRGAGPCAQEQRKQELPGELPIANPGFASFVLLERADVDEHRAPADELDVVRGRVFDRQPF